MRRDDGSDIDIAFHEAHLTKPAKPPPMAGRKQEVLQPRE